VTPVRAAIALLAARNAQIVSFNMSEPDIEAIMKAPFTMASSDGGLPRPDVGHPHPRDYGAFARRLAVYVRDRKVVPLEFAIRSMTSLPATVFGLTDRGVIRPRAFADLVIFDPAAIRDMATYAEPQKLAIGVSYVFVKWDRGVGRRQAHRGGAGAGSQEAVTEAGFALGFLEPASQWTAGPEPALRATREPL
jgi:N-acyl-D-aspartate/D-glutamate deacylase